MNQLKIGKFIAKCRKMKNMTQADLAEKLNITDRAISKWETGKGMPDSSIMLDLCDELSITVNELLSGEKIRSIVTISFLLIIFLSIFAIDNTIWKITSIVIGFIIFIIGISNCLLIEQKAGYYQCNNCKYKYIPTYKQVLFAMHSGRTRYMRCPKCDKKTWNKKVID